jgi:hypothetical protein
MRGKLDKARRQYEDGEHNAAINTLWTVEHVVHKGTDVAEAEAFLASATFTSRFASAPATVDLESPVWGPLAAGNREAVRLLCNWALPARPSATQTGLVPDDDPIAQIDRLAGLHRCGALARL